MSILPQKLNENTHAETASKVAMAKGTRKEGEDSTTVQSPLCDSKVNGDKKEERLAEFVITKQMRVDGDGSVGPEGLIAFLGKDNEQ
jgi:hypothetical protein